jgi:hypothetical protein
MRAWPLLLVAALARAEAPDRHPWERRHVAASRHYVVETNTFPELARSLLDALEAAYPLFEERFGPLEGRARRPMHVHLFRTREEYARLGEGVEGAAGHFDPSLDLSVLAWRGENGDEGWPIAVHEACHHYLARRRSGWLPSWYAEGIACWFEGAFDPAGIARLRAHTARSALEEGTLSLDALLESPARVEGRRIRADGFAPARYYAVAWSFVHFLASDPATREAFRRFELRLFALCAFPEASLPRVRALLAEECGDLAALEARWREHVRAMADPPPRPLPPVYGFELGAATPYARFLALSRLRARPLPEDLRAAVVERLSDDDLVVRAAAAEAIAGGMGGDAVPALVRALDLGDAPLKAAALRALAHPSAADAVPRLLAEREARDAALLALAAIGDARAHPALRAAVSDPRLEPGTRAACAAAIAPRGEAREDAEAARAALRWLEGARGPSAAAAGARALAAQVEAHLPAPPPRREGAVAELARDPLAPIDARVAACRLLGLARAHDAVPALRRLCRAAEPDRLRLEAARALVRITGETRGFEPGQSETAREAAYRAWAE